MKEIPGVNRYYALRQWVIDEIEKGNRSKASSINKVAEKLKPNCKVYPPIARPPRKKMIDNVE